MSIQAAGRRSAEPTAEPPRPARPPAPPRRVTPSQAVAAHPFLVVLPVLLLMVPALAFAFARQPVHTAEARLLVGGFNVEAQAVPGFVEASRTLAETYSRLVTTPAIAERAATLLEVDVEDVVDHIDATSVPESSIIRVTGTGTTQAASVRFAAAAAEALEAYADESGAGTDLEALLDEFRAASLVLNQTTARRDALQRSYDARVAAGTVTEADLGALSEAEADVDRAQLEADTLAAAFADQRGRSGASGNIDLVAPASHVGTDQRSNVQLAIVGPLLLGLIVGVALATLVANRRQLPAAHASRP